MRTLALGAAVLAIAATGLPAQSPRVIEFRPMAGATIPTLGIPQPQVPEAWVRTFRDIPSTERWEPVALRQYKEG